MSSTLLTLASSIRKARISKAVPGSRRINLKPGLLGPALIQGDPSTCRVGTPRSTFSYLNGVIPFLKLASNLAVKCCAQYLILQTFQDGLLVASVFVPGATYVQADLVCLLLSQRSI